ncbi:unnamed protein product [Rhizophagus irregularis]|uniref:HTH CENPB-type domain-containing protein n=1 Tax=Rhizophagus irregularis TaxID=588596 RepID=A0A915ZH06_9GLOM|nr:unnamed protein product [Rhizophagus irregularis]
MRENKDTNNKKKKSLTLAQKKELCEKQRDQKLSGVQLAAQYGISTSTVSDILKRSEHWLSIDTTLPNANNFREKSSVYPQLEEVMSIWVDQQISRNLTINGPIIQQKAVECANLLDITNFSASAEWLSNFKQRNNLHTYKKKGEAGSAPIDELPQMRAELREILQAYELKDIWNCDETALFWRLEPSKTIAHDPVLGKKRPKERVSILATCNASGDERLPLVFIHKYETPCALKGIEKRSLPVCWAKAGILPNNNMEDSECSDNSDYEEDNIGHELQSLIDELGFVDPLAVNDYINIDNRASAEEELSLQEIVDIVKGTNEREIEEEEEQDEISTIVALNSIENVIKYIQQKDLEIGNLEMKNLIKLKKRIFFDNINEKRQSKLNEYFDFNV